MATIEDIKTLYSSHEEAGKAYYDQFRAERAQKVLNNETTIESETELSLHLKDVKQEMLSGDWRTSPEPSRVATPFAAPFSLL